jgi:hypothetical protein
VTRCGTGPVIDTSLGEVSRLVRSHGGHAKVEHGNNSPAEFSQILGEQVVLAKETTNANRGVSEDFKVASKNPKVSSENPKAANEKPKEASEKPKVAIDDSMTLAEAETSTPQASPVSTAAKKISSHEDALIHLAKGEQDLPLPSSALPKVQERVAKQEPRKTDLAAQSSDDKSSRKVESASLTWPSTQEKDAEPAKVLLSSQNQPAQTVAHKLQQTMGADIADTSPVEPSKSHADVSISEQKPAVTVPLQVSNTADHSAHTTAHVGPMSRTQDATTNSSANSHHSSPSFGSGIQQKAQSSLGRVETSSQQRSMLSTQEPSVDASDEARSDSAPQLKQPDHGTPTPRSASKIQEPATPPQLPSHRVSAGSALPIKAPAGSAAAQKPTSDVVAILSDHAQPSEASTSDSVPDETIRTDAIQTSAAMVAALHASYPSPAPTLVQGQVHAKASTSAHANLATSPIHHNAHVASEHAFAPSSILPRGSTTARAKTAPSGKPAAKAALEMQRSTTAQAKSTSSGLESTKPAVLSENTSIAPKSEEAAVPSPPQEAHLTGRISNAAPKVTATDQPSNMKGSATSVASSHIGQAIKADSISNESTATAKTLADEVPATAPIVHNKAPIAAKLAPYKVSAPTQIVSTTTPDTAHSVPNKAPASVKFVTHAFSTASVIVPSAAPAAAANVPDKAPTTAQIFPHKVSAETKIISDKIPATAPSSPDKTLAAAQNIAQEVSATTKIIPDKTPVTAQIVSREVSSEAKIVSNEAPAKAPQTATPAKQTISPVESATERLPRTNKSNSPAPTVVPVDRHKEAALPSAHEQTTQKQVATSDSATPSDAPTILLSPPTSQEPRKTKSESSPKVTQPTASIPVAARTLATEQVAVQASAGGKAATVKPSSKIGSEQAKAPLSTVPTATPPEAALAAPEQPATRSPIQAKQTPIASATHTAGKNTAQLTSDPVKPLDTDEDDDAESPLPPHTASPASHSQSPIPPPAALNLSPSKADSPHPVHHTNGAEPAPPSKDVQPTVGPTHVTKGELPSPTVALNSPTTVLPTQSTWVSSNQQAAPLEISKPSPLDSAKANIIDKAVEDPGLSVSVMPHSAHLSIASNTGDLALHVRIRDGNADVNVSGAMAPLFDSKAPEVRAVLAGQGLSLGSYATDQQGGYQGQQGQQGQPDNTPRTSDVLPLPTPRRTSSSTPEVQLADERRIHVTA